MPLGQQRQSDEQADLLTSGGHVALYTRPLDAFGDVLRLIEGGAQVERTGAPTGAELNVDGPFTATWSDRSANLGGWSAPAVLAVPRSRQRRHRPLRCWCRAKPGRRHALQRVSALPNEQRTVL